MSLAAMISLAILAVFLIIAVAQLPKYWRGELVDLHHEGTKRWWPFGEAVRRGFIRGLHIGVAAIVALLAGIAGTVVSQNAASSTLRDVGSEAADWCFLLFAALIVLDVSVTLFNRPKFVVPPHARNEPGALRHLFGRRQGVD